MAGAPTRGQLLKLYRNYLATAQSFVSISSAEEQLKTFLSSGLTYILIAPL